LIDASISCRCDSSSCLRRARNTFRRVDFFDLWLVSVFSDFMYQEYEKPSVGPLRAGDLEPSGPGGAAYETSGFSREANMHTSTLISHPEVSI